MYWLEILLCVLIGYSLGNINPAFSFAKSRGYDARVDGSGNAGASNAFLLAGKRAFFITALLDIAKAWLACRICSRLFPELPVAEQIGGVSCIIGHIFPVVLRFRGGRGLASLGGVVLSWDWKIFLMLLALSFVIALVTNYLCFVAPTMAGIVPGLYYWQTHALAASLILLVPFLPILYKHTENFRRILKGTEARFSYLWDRESELRRMGR